VIQKVTWTGGNVPTGEDAVFQFLASPSASKTYTFSVRQTYSNGKVVDWSGPESSDAPAPTIEAKGSLGGGGSTLAIVALAVAAALALPAAAWAHAALLRTVPSASGILNSPPTQVRLTYSESVEPRFAIVSVTDAGGHRETTGPPRRSPSNADELDVPLRNLA